MLERQGHIGKRRYVGKFTSNAVDQKRTQRDHYSVNNLAIASYQFFQ